MGTQRPTNDQPPTTTIQHPTNNNAQDEEFGHRRIFQHCSGQARPWSCSPARPPPRRPPQCRPPQCVPPPTCPPARSTCGGQGGPKSTCALSPSSAQSPSSPSPGNT